MLGCGPTNRYWNSSVTIHDQSLLILFRSPNMSNERPPSCVYMRKCKSGLIKKGCLDEWAIFWPILHLMFMLWPNYHRNSLKRMIHWKLCWRMWWVSGRLWKVLERPRAKQNLKLSQPCLLQNHSRPSLTTGISGGSSPAFWGFNLLGDVYRDAQYWYLMCDYVYSPQRTVYILSDLLDEQLRALWYSPFQSDDMETDQDMVSVRVCFFCFLIHLIFLPV